MTDEYRLIYSGEVFEGQHSAVVKKRLAALLKLDGERMDVLFSGKAVVVKKAADEKTAARYQAAFQKAGARLRVLPLDEADTESPSNATPPSATEPDTASPAASGGLAVLPPGSAVLNDDERQDFTPVDVNTDHLSVAGASFAIDGDDPNLPEPEVPNVDHLSVAELGALIGQEQNSDDLMVAEIEVDFDLAEVGAIIGQVDATLDDATLAAVPEGDFDLAEPGSTLSQKPAAASPAAPDTSHLSVDDS